MMTPVRASGAIVGRERELPTVDQIARLIWIGFHDQSVDGTFGYQDDAVKTRYWDIAESILQYVLDVVDESAKVNR